MPIGFVHLYPICSPSMMGASLILGCFAFDSSLNVSRNIGPHPTYNIHRLEIAPRVDGRLTSAPSGLFFGGNPGDPGLTQSPPVLTWIPETNPTVLWSSSNPTVAILSEQTLSRSGESQILATFAGVGSTIISASVGTAMASATLTVNATIAPGDFEVRYGIAPSGQPYTFLWHGKRIFAPN